MAENTLRQSLAEFKTLGMAEEEAWALLLIGEICASEGRDHEALLAWNEGLTRIRKGAPEIRIGCLIGLASLEAKSSISKAAGLIKRAALTVRELAPDFWQASIFSWHVNKLSTHINHILRFFLRHEQPLDAIRLLEAIKAHAFRQAALTEIDEPALRSELAGLRASTEPVKTDNRNRARESDWLKRLALTQSEYAALTPHIETIEKRYEVAQRELTTAQKGDLLDFDVVVFQNNANRRLGRNWIGVDYYVTDDEIMMAIITSEQIFFKSTGLTPRLKMALAGSAPSTLEGTRLKSDLAVLADQLLPLDLMKRMAEDSTIILSPHKQLWFVPWAALPLGDQFRCLVDKFSTSTTPSLESLLLLWERPVEKSPENERRGGVYWAYRLCW